VETDNLERMQLFHSLMGKITVLLKQHVLPVFCKAAKDVLNPVVYHRRSWFHHERSQNALVSGQLMLQTESIGHFPAKICSKLIAIRFLKTVAFWCKILRCSLMVKSHQSFSVSRKKTGNKAALKDTPENSLEGVVLGRRKVLCRRKGRNPDDWELAQ
jgi:hypothetical protein